VRDVYGKSRAIKGGESPHARVRLKRLPGATIWTRHAAFFPVQRKFLWLHFEAQALQPLTRSIAKP